MSPGTADIDFDYGPGTFNYLAPASGLEDLASYRSTLTMSFAGTESGQPAEWTKTYEMIVTREPAARQLTFLDTGVDGRVAAVPVYRAEINGVAYEQRGDEPCKSGPIFADDALATRWEPAGFLPGVTGGVESGAEAVNGVPATRYDFDERAFGSLPESSATGQMWVASDGSFVVKYVLATTAAAEYFGEGSEGTLTSEYEVTDVNAAPAINLPAECPEQLTDAPLPADATDVVRVPGLVSYTTSLGPEEVLTFTADALSALGWQSVVEPTLGATTMVQTFRRDADQVSAVVTAVEGGTSVRLVFGGA